jgi:hypothetical protein
MRLLNLRTCIRNSIYLSSYEVNVLPEAEQKVPMVDNSPQEGYLREIEHRGCLKE